METINIFKDLLIPIAGIIIASFAAFQSISVYKKNSEFERSKWLYSLFEKFFYENQYSEIRRFLDYDDEPEIQRLKEAVISHTETQLEEKLVDYLNFFEFIAILWKLEQLSISEIRMMFDYYIRRLGEYDFVMHYLEQQSFENLNELVKEIRTLDKL
jgi:hypothetical protein